jgi:drug/metabolite transporter (DMT)-like permease
MMRRAPIPHFGIFCALLSAVLFGASTPLAKVLLGEGTDPFLLAGLFYLGSGLGLSVVRLSRARTVEAPLAKADWKWMAPVILAGGVAGPVLLMVGLQTMSASSAALLLNFESLATFAIAWIVFHEHTDRRLLTGAAAILAGAVLLSWRPGPHPLELGALAIIGACIAWGIDNNLTRKLSAADPVTIAQVKGLVAGVVNVALAFALGAAWPSGPGMLAAMIVGFLGYGVSLVFFTLGLRHLGAARTGAYFATAPFIGAVLAVAMLGEPVTVQLTGAVLLMALGVGLHLTERHSHRHTHMATEHEHLHTHDEHHQYAHGPADPADAPHTHRHVHARQTHEHPHYPDIHHGHRHGTH